MLPISLRLVYALNNATFEVSSLALLSIVNTRASIPAEYLPAYGAISFLPYSLRPIFAWISSMLLNCTSQKDKSRHDKLLFPAFLLASLSFVGTTFIPSDGIILCFFWGFLRGIAGAWTDFLIGMAVIEFSRLHVGLGGSTYEHTVSINTAQSSTAKNIGSFVASITTFVFFAKQKNLSETVANKLLLGTAAIFLLAALVSVKFQFYVGNLSENLSVQQEQPRYETVDNQAADDAASVTSANSAHYSASSFQHSSISEHSGSERLGSSDGSDSISSSSLLFEMEDATASKKAHRGQIFEVSTLVAFQILLAVSALQKPIIAISSQIIWISLVATFAISLIFIISLGYRYERQSMMGSRPLSNDEARKLGSQKHRLPHRQLNLYFLLRYSLPIAGFLMYSYLYSVFEKEPSFLQLLSVLKTAIGSLSTFCYEKFLSPHCHSGWPLIILIACLDIIMGFVALLDVWIIRAVKSKEVDGEYTVDTPLRCLVTFVGLAKYFFAELDYMPALVLTTTNVYSDSDKNFENRDHCETPAPRTNDDFGEQSAEMTSLSAGFPRPSVSALSIDLNDDEEDGDIARTPTQRLPLISAGMQYASFLSCIDFGAQIGDWITVPIVASLGIKRENHWDNLDKLVMICSIFRMTRVVFLWLILPPSDPKHIESRSEHNEYSNVNDSSTSA